MPGFLRRISTGFSQGLQRKMGLKDLAIGVLLLIPVFFVLCFPPYQRDQARFTCNGCGNRRTVVVRVEWWTVDAVWCLDNMEHPVPTGHVHNWWQWDGDHRKSFGYLHGWHRDPYEDGRWYWDDPPTKTPDPSRRRMEDWVRVR